MRIHLHSSKPSRPAVLPALLMVGLLAGATGPAGAQLAPEQGQSQAVPEESPAVSPPNLTPMEAPPAATATIEDVRRSVSEIDSLVLQGDTETARKRLEEAEQQLDTVREQHGDEMPAGHVPMLVLEERLAVLRQQLDAQN